MSEANIRKTTCEFCGEEIFNNKRFDHLPCNGVEQAEDDTNPKTVGGVGR